MFGIGFQEMLIILVVVLIFFGPKRLPDLAKSLGKGIAEFKKASEEIRKGIDDAVKEGEKASAEGAVAGPGSPGAAVPADAKAPESQDAQKGTAPEAPSPSPGHDAPSVAALEVGKDVIPPGRTPPPSAPAG